jgi:hypothetical protein
MITVLRFAVLPLILALATLTVSVPWLVFRLEDRR